MIISIIIIMLAILHYLYVSRSTHAFEMKRRRMEMKLLLEMKLLPEPMRSHAHVCIPTKIHLSLAVTTAERWVSN